MVSREPSPWLLDGLGLVGRLSNPDLGTLFQGLTAREWTQEAPRTRSREIVPDAKRKFGTVRDAVIQVLTEADCALRVRDIHERVEEVLGGPVAASSVKVSLRTGCRCLVPRFEYCGRSGYRLLRPTDLGS